MVTIPTDAALESALDEARNAPGLDEQERAARIETLKETQNLLSQYQKAHQQRAELATQLANAPKTREELSKRYLEDRERYTLKRDDPLWESDQELRELAERASQSQDKSKSSGIQLEAQGRALLDLRKETDLEEATALEQALKSADTQAGEAQQALSDAQADYNWLQTLPERAQNEIIANDRQIALQLTELHKLENQASPEAQVLATRVLLLREMSALLQEELAGHMDRIEIANLKVRLNTLASAYANARVEVLQQRRSAQMSKEQDSSKESAAALPDVPALREQQRLNEGLRRYIDQQRQQQLEFEHLSRTLDTKLSQAHQLRTEVRNEVERLDKGLLLSRLLNRQQNETAQLQVALDIEDKLTEIGVMLFEIRHNREQMFDLEQYANNMCAAIPALKDHREALDSILSERRTLLEDAGRIYTDELALGISLKSRHSQLNQMREEIRLNINANLIWLKSNNTLDDLASFVNLGKMFKAQVMMLPLRVRNMLRLGQYLSSAAMVLVPLLLLGALLWRARGWLQAQHERLTARVGTRADSPAVTPLAMLNAFARALPATSLWTLAGAPVVMCALPASTFQQSQVLLMLALHVLVFQFFFVILNEGGLAYAHLGIKPQQVQHLRLLLRRLWLFMVPVLLIGNIWQTDTANIFYDAIGMVTVLICCLGQFGVALWWLAHHSGQLRAPLVLRLAAILAGASGLGLGIAVAAGYYLPSMQLCNRLAVTNYLILGFALLSLILRRTLAVLELRQRFTAQDKNHAAAPAVSTDTAHHPEDAVSAASAPAGAQTGTAAAETGMAPADGMQEKMTAEAEKATENAAGKAAEKVAENATEKTAAEGEGEEKEQAPEQKKEAAPGYAARNYHAKNDDTEDDAADDAEDDADDDEEGHSGSALIPHFNRGMLSLLNYLLALGTLGLIYLLWRDLFGAMGYLETIRIGADTQLVNGTERQSGGLSLAALIKCGIIAITTVLVNRTVPRFLARLVVRRQSKQQLSNAYTIRIMTSYICIATGITAAGKALGLSWDSLQWLVAALSVGLGFGLQEIFANFVSGIIILFERQLRINDIVTIGSVSGTVRRIRIRSTTLETFDSKEMLIPNKQFITGTLTNWSLSNTVTKVEFAVGISYNNDPEKARRILLKIIDQCPYLAPVPPAVYVTSLDDSSVNLNCEVYVAEIGKRKATTDYLCTETLSQFARAGIEIPYPQQDVHVRDLPQRSPAS